MKHCWLLFTIFLLALTIRAQKLPIKGEWKFTQKNDTSNAQPELKDEAWETVDGTIDWFTQKKAEGSVTSTQDIWLRKKIVIPLSMKKELQKTGALALYLGKVQELDECFLNGKTLSKTNNRAATQAYLLVGKDILWDKENSIAMRVKYWINGIGISRDAAIAATKPEQIFITGSGNTGLSPKSQVSSKSAVYAFNVKNLSEKSAEAQIVASFRNIKGEKVQDAAQKILLKPGENVLHFPYKSASPFLKITYSVNIPAYQYNTVWNAVLGYEDIVYSSVQPVIDYQTSEVFTPADLHRQVITGWLGNRLKANKDQRLANVDETALLAGFINKPGTHPWIGEHIGKFLEAACNTYKNTSDPALKIQIDRSAQQLIASQLANGYLGTYDSANYWTSWDVWSHKYDLIGLLAYYQLSGYKPALEASRKIGDLLVSTFGTAPGQLDIIKSGTHVGMAATSVLDPLTDLYRFTGTKSYLDFCYYITSSFDQPNGPKIISTLDSTGQVDKTANAKAYEMLSNLVGLIKFYKLTGNEKFLTPVNKAWIDIVKHRLYITGTTSTKEHFVADGLLPAGVEDNMGEGCVTTTWLQLNYQLLCLKGNMAYLDELERSVYNHLTGAENPETGCVSYYTPLMGVKPYHCRITCCLSSVPRGIAMIPAFANGKIKGDPSIFFYQPGVYSTSLDDEGKTNVSFKTTTDFPEDGNVNITVDPARTTSFAVNLRKPYWAEQYRILVNGVEQKITGNSLQSIHRSWTKGDIISVHFTMPVRPLDGGSSYPGSLAFQRGPQVLAFDKSLNAATAETLIVAPDAPVQKSSYPLPKGWIGSQIYTVQGLSAGKNLSVVLVPYADASQQGGEVTTWLKKNP